MFFNWLNNKKDEWTPGYAEDTLQRANSYLLPTIGKMSIDEISSSVMLNDKKLRDLQPKDKLYRVSDSHGLCIEINPNGL